MNVNPRDILFRCGATDLARYGRLTRTTVPEELTGYVFKETLSRATTKNVRGKDGYLLGVGTDLPGIDWVDASTPTLRLEAARTQLVTDPENFGAWSVSGTPVRTSGQADPFGGTAAYLLGDDDAGAVEYIQQTVGFTGNAEKAFALFVKEGTSVGARLRIIDTTAGVTRHGMNLTWAAGVPSLATVGGEGSGTIFPAGVMAGGWYRVPFTAAGIVAANTNVFRILPTTDSAALTGNFSIFGANAWNATVPGSYQGPSLGTRNADGLTFPYMYEPQGPLWIYVKFIESGAIYAAAGNFPTLLQIGNFGASPNWRHLIAYNGAAGHYRMWNDNSGGGVNVTLGASPTMGQTVELLGQVYADGSIQLRQSINGAADTATSVSSAQTLPSSFGATMVLRLGDTTYPESMFRYIRVVVGLGTPTSIADVRSLP